MRRIKERISLQKNLTDIFSQLFIIEIFKIYEYEFFLNKLASLAGKHRFARSVSLSFDPLRLD